MKRLIVFLLCVLLFCVSFIPVASAAGAITVGLSGSTTIRAGDTVTYDVKISGVSSAAKGVEGVQFDLLYDGGILEYQSATSKQKSQWKLGVTEGAGKLTVLFADEDLEVPITSNATLFSVTFKVKSTAAVGDKAAFSFQNLAGTDGTVNSISSVSGTSFTATVAAPLSSNNYLQSLSVNTGTLTPAFSSTRTSYSLTVPFGVSSIAVLAKPQDANATVKVSGAKNLYAGQVNTVTVTVMAQNGSKKTYTLKVTQEADPNAATPTPLLTASPAATSTTAPVLTATPTVVPTVSPLPVNAPTQGIHWTVLVIAIILALAVGFNVGYFIGKSKEMAD